MMKVKAAPVSSRNGPSFGASKNSPSMTNMLCERTVSDSEQKLREFGGGLRFSPPYMTGSIQRRTEGTG